MTNSDRIRAAMQAIENARAVLRDAPQFKVVSQAYADLWEAYEALEDMLPESSTLDEQYDPHDAMDQGRNN